jgi:hypothetical protein
MTLPCSFTLNGLIVVPLMRLQRANLSALSATPLSGHTYESPRD